MRWPLLAAILYSGIGDAATLVVVDKSDRKLFVYSVEYPSQSPPKSQLVASYDVAIGRDDEGHKRRRGDMRTPEGHYTLTRRTCQFCKYKRAFDLNYPNAKDRREGRTGSAILIHKAWPMQQWTEGCIALREFDELWSLVPDGTPIEVRP